MTVLPDVERARALAESAMVDTCIVYRDQQGSADDTLNEVTGALTQPVGDQTTVYEGPCLLRTRDVQPSSDAEGGAQVGRRLQAARVPVTAPKMVAGDILEVLTSSHDPLLAGRRYLVVDITVNTFAVTRKLTLEDHPGQVVR